MRECQELVENWLAKGIMAPSDKVRLGAMILLGSMVRRVPRPVQVGQAPWGELKENILGSISGKLRLQSWQAKFSENKWLIIFLGLSGKLKDESLTWVSKPRPLLSFKAVSKEEAKRFFNIPTSEVEMSCFWLIVILSMTASIVWRLVLIKTIDSSRLINWPSILTLWMPLDFKFLSRSVNSPFLSRTIGLRIIKRLIWVEDDWWISFKTCLMIWSRVCFWISLPHSGQWGRPIRAKRSLK